MFYTTKTVEVNNVTPVLKQDYQKVVFDGTSLDDKGKATGGNAEELLEAAVKFFADKLNGDQDKAVREILNRLTYAYDLDVRNGIRTDLTSGGPEKAIEGAIKKFMQAREKAGKPVTEDFARKKVMALMSEE